MSIALISRAMWLPIDSTSKIVLIALADHADDEGGSVRPSIERVCLRTSLSRRAVQGAIAHLEGHEILVKAWHGGGRGNTHRWKIDADLLQSVGDGIEATWKTWTRSDKRVQYVHPFAGKGASCDRKGCSWCIETVHLLHLNHQRTVSEPAADLLSIQYPRQDGEPIGTYLARLSLLRKEA